MNSKERKDLANWLAKQKKAADKKAYKEYAEQVTGKPWHIITESLEEQCLKTS